MSKKKTTKYVVIGLLILFLGIVATVMVIKNPFQQTEIGDNEDSTPTSDTTYGGNSGGGTAPAEEEDNFNWFTFWIPTTTERPECTKDADCINKCAGQYYQCVDNKCGCTAPASEVAEPYCDDSDTMMEGRSGTTDKNWEEKGTCVEEPYSSRGNSDYCNSRGELVEYYCDGTCKTIAISCPRAVGDTDAFCNDGACTWLV